MILFSTADFLNLSLVFSRSLTKSVRCFSKSFLVVPAASFSIC
ncbi:hypothetical protein [Candidatus Phytoplasma fraxini]